MRLKKMEMTRVCEIKGCNNDADFYIDTKGFIKTRVCFCEDCLKKMFKGYLGTSVPKSIESPFKPFSRLRKEEK